MSTVVLSLFGDEIIPEQINAVGKSRAARKPKAAAKNEGIEPEVKEEEKAPSAQAAVIMPEEAVPERKTEDTYPAIEVVKEITQEEAVSVVAIEPEVEQIQDISPVSIVSPEVYTEAVAPTDIVPVESEPVSISVETVQEPVKVPEATQEILSIAETSAEKIEAVAPVVEVVSEIVKTARKPAAKRVKSAVKKTAIKKEVVKKEKPEGHSILEGWTPDKQYYSIGEVANLFYVATSHIRFWTNEFALKVRTTRKGDRLYSPEQINELRTIYHLVKEKGYTIAGAKARLKEAKKTPVHTLDLKQSLLQLRNKLVDIKNQL